MLLMVKIQQNIDICRTLYLFHHFSYKTTVMAHKHKWRWVDTCIVVRYNQSSYHKWEISGTYGFINQQTLPLFEMQSQAN